MPATSPRLKADAPARVLRVLLLVIAVIAVLRTMPLAANVDDQVRLYFGGYVGRVQLAGGAPAQDLAAALQAARERIADPYLTSRFAAAHTPYSPLEVAVAAAAEFIRPLLPEVRILPWILGVQTALWLFVLAVADRARARLPECSLAWFLAAALALSWIHPHTQPFSPVPRAFACLFTGLALALAATGASARWAVACALAAAASHPYNQVVNLGVVLPAAAVVGGTELAPHLRSRTAMKIAAIACAAVVVALAIVWLAHSGRGADVGAMLGDKTAFDPAQSWRAARPAALRLAIGIGLPLTALVGRYGGVGRAVAVGALFAATVLAAACLQPSGYYAGEYVSRVGGAWVALLFGLGLRRELLPDLANASVRRGWLVAAATAVVTLPAAVPEWARVPNTIHAPARGWPAGLRLRVADLSPVEIECVRILRAGGRTTPSQGAEAAGRGR